MKLRKQIYLCKFIEFNDTEFLYLSTETENAHEVLDNFNSIKEFKEKYMNILEKSNVDGIIQDFKNTKI